MEYCNYNKTPIDRIDEALMKELYELDCDNSCDSKNSCKSNQRSRTRNCNCRNTRKDYSGSGENLKDVCGISGNTKSATIQGVSLAMVYSPYQAFDELYEIEDGFVRGTLFKSLDFPFYMDACNSNTGSKCNCGCIK